MLGCKRVLDIEAGFDSCYILSGCDIGEGENGERGKGESIAQTDL